MIVKDHFTHEQVFDWIPQKTFSALEASEYLEVSIPTLLRYVQSGKLVPNHIMGPDQIFSAQTLRAFKCTLRRDSLYTQYLQFSVGSCVQSRDIPSGAEPIEVETARETYGI